jgi:hypothetical protein
MAFLPYTPYDSGPGQSRATPAKLSEGARGRKGRIVWEGLSENAEELLGRVVLLGEEHPEGDVPWRVLVEATGFDADVYEAAAEELVEAGLAETDDSDYAGLTATTAGKEWVTGL